jgi:enoyl-[acyl-carrier protein] reductase II
VRALKNKGTTQFGRLQFEIIDKLDRGAIDPLEAQFEVEKFWAGALREAAVEGKVRSGSLMAGQSVGLADKVMPIEGIIAELIQDAETELQRLHQLFHTTCT